MTTPTQTNLTNKNNLFHSQATHLGHDEFM